MTGVFRVIGTMSGTSCDGIDIGLIETDGVSQTVILGGCTFPYEKDFSNKLKNAYLAKDYREVLFLEKRLTELHSEAINSFLCSQNISVNHIDLIGFHGHTVFHEPANGITWQIGNSPLLSSLTGITVVSDFRRMDIANGGQGAPLAPLFHQHLSRHLLRLDTAVFLNIGGVSNITYIRGEQLIASDVGPGNALIDDFISRSTNFSYDDDGKFAVKGQINHEVVESFLNNGFFQLAMPKSLDRNHFNYIKTHHLTVEDGAATLTYLTVRAIADAIKKLQDPNIKVIVCGGGRKNLFLMAKLQSEVADIDVVNIDDLKIDGDLVEAYAFAYLAARSLKNLPISYPETTGVQMPCTGVAFTKWYCLKNIANPIKRVMINNHEIVDR